MPELELSAGTIEYEDTGGDGPAIVFSHGLFMDGSQWRHVVADLRCRLPLCAAHAAARLPSPPDASRRRPLDARHRRRSSASCCERLDLRGVTLAMNDWGGPQLLVGSRYEQRIARLVICSCEAFDNVPPKGTAKALPYIARLPGGIAAVVFPFRFDRLRRLPVTYGALSRRPVPREVMDRWFGPAIAQRAVRRDVAKYVRSSAQGRRDLLAAADALRAFEGPALIAWASENRMMPREHGRRLAELLPHGRLVEIPDSYTLITEDQPAQLVACMREFLRDTQPQLVPPTADVGPRRSETTR